MRCPKCGYNSFDHNPLCPKCRKDLTATRRLLNLTVPVPGPTNFFQTAGERSAFPEPLLGGEMSSGFEPGPGLLAAGALAAGAFGAAGAAGAFDAAAPFGATPPFGAAAPFAPPPFLGEATIDDIMPLEADEDLDEIAPIESEALDEIVPIESENAFATSIPVPASFPPRPVTEAASPALGEEEIEIEIDDLVEPAEISPTDDQQSALDHIKNTLAETGDLGLPVAVDIPGIPEVDVPEISIMESGVPDIDVVAAEAPAESPVFGDLEPDELDEQVFDDIDDSDILEADAVEEPADQPSDTVAVDLDPEDLAPDFFEEVAPEPAPALGLSPQLEEAPSLEDLAQGDLAGPFWDEDDQPVLEEASPDLEIESLSLEEPALASPPEAEPSFEGAADLDIEPEDMAESLETDLSDFDQELTAEEMFAEEIQIPEAPPLEAAPAPAAEATSKPVHPAAVPEMPASLVFGAASPEATLSASKTAPGTLDADDLSSLADDLNLDDLDSEL